MNSAAGNAAGEVNPAPSECEARILVLGLGNELLSDDGVGFAVVRAVAAEVADRRDILCRESSAVGWALLDEILGFETVIVVDAIVTGTAPPGDLHQIDPRQVLARAVWAPHRVGLPEALKLAARLELPLPVNLEVFAVEILDGETFGSQLTPAVTKALPAIAARIARALRAHCGGSPAMLQASPDR